MADEKPADPKPVDPRKRVKCKEKIEVVIADALLTDTHAKIVFPSGDKIQIPIAEFKERFEVVK